MTTSEGISSRERGRTGVTKRTTNIVESPFASVRLRINAGMRYKRVENATAPSWKVLLGTERTPRKLNAPAGRSGSLERSTKTESPFEVTRTGLPPDAVYTPT